MRAATEELREVFDKVLSSFAQHSESWFLVSLISCDYFLVQYATVVKNGEKFIDARDFVQKFLGLFNDVESDGRTIELFGSIADTSKDGYVQNRLEVFSMVFY